ncbi:MAG TPA: hypothetical protein VJL88_05710 [Nitrospira sp.]|nr:hypothetical protein [Nitrospira sp.]
MAIRSLRIHEPLSAPSRLVSILTTYQELTWELTKRELTERYAGQMLGALWAFGHPLLLMGVYVFVFGFLYPSRLQDVDIPKSFATYILSGLIPWLAFADSMTKGTGVLAKHASLVKQVVFPIEILPVKAVLASFITELVMVACLLVYMLAADAPWPMTLALLPVLLVLQLGAMIGVSYVLAPLGAYLRDLKDVLQVFLSAGLFLTPIFYVPTWFDGMWAPFKVVVYANPFSHLVWCYQDVLFFGRVEHVFSWIAVVALSLMSVYFGYRLFEKVKVRFGDIL